MVPGPGAAIKGLCRQPLTGYPLITEYSSNLLARILRVPFIYDVPCVGEKRSWATVATQGLQVCFTMGRQIVAITEKRPFDTLLVEHHIFLFYDHVLVVVGKNQYLNWHRWRTSSKKSVTQLVNCF